jgi:D-tyrosyl-tRNA(Tyr) deacylase
MRAVIQRTTGATVKIDGNIVGEIGTGFVILLGIGLEDSEEDAMLLADKCTGLRIFEDENEKMNLSLSQVNGQLLVISNFTLYADCRQRRPSFSNAARPEQAVPLYERFITECRDKGFEVQTGEFGADMKLSVLNDGPVTLIIDTKDFKKQ